MRQIIFSIIFFLCAAFVYGAGGDDIWNKANKEYSDGKFADALAGYIEIEKTVGVSAALYYNMGNCYFKEGNIGKAILYYNRALRLNPNNKDIIHNLSVANELTLNKIAEKPEFFIERWLKQFANIASTGGWAVFSIIFFAITMVMLVLFTLSKSPIYRKLTFGIGMTTFLVTIVAIISSVYRNGVIINDNEGIIMQRSVAVKSSPDEAGKDLFVLSEGIKVTIDEKIGSWSEITIASGESGWVESNNIEVI